MTAEAREPMYPGPVEAGSEIAFGRATPGRYVVIGRTERAADDFILRIGGVDAVPGAPSSGRLFLLMFSAAVAVAIPVVWVQYRWRRRIEPEIQA